jgi:hypothetical protein
LFRRKSKLRKRNKHEFWVKWGGLGAFVAKNSTASFLFQKSLERPSRASFATLFRRKPKLPKRKKHEFWVKRGGLGAFVAENSTASFLFQKSLKRQRPADDFAQPVSVRSKTETPKTQQT